MLSSLPTVANLPAAAPPAPHTASSGSGETPDATEGGSFAQALEQAASPHAPGSAAGAARARGAAAAKAAAASAERGREHKGGTEAVCQAPETQALADRAEAETRTDAEAGEPGTPAAVCVLLADLQARSAAAPATAASAAAAASTAPGSDTAEAGTAKGKARIDGGELLRGATQPRNADVPTAPADRRSLPPAAPSGRHDAAPALPGDRQPLAADTSALARNEAAVTVLSTAAPSSGSPVPATFAAALAATTSTPAAAPAEATLTAHPASAEFGPQLGATLSTFVRQGIEHARLHLNPAELGPVQVQIQLDGTHAQILLGAENALTRQALEQSLPLLAGTLREAGLTLAGGGVFEQARQGGGEAGGNGSAAHGAPGGPSGRNDGLAEPAELTTGARVRSRGVVDLVA